MGRNLFIEFPVGVKTDQVVDPLLLAVLVDVRAGEGGVAPKPEKPEPGTVSLHDGMNESEGSIDRVNVARPEPRPQAGAVAREDKQGMGAVRAEVAIIRNSTLAAVSQVLGGIDIDDEPPLVLKNSRSSLQSS
jgi:hypothetical protein